MRLNSYTTNEIEILEQVTAARCSVTPKLLAVGIETQDESILNADGKPELQDEWGDVKWWMPGGYIVYILMSKLPGVSLVEFWDEKIYTPYNRQEIRKAFRESD